MILRMYCITVYRINWKVIHIEVEELDALVKKVYQYHLSIQMKEEKSLI